MKHLGMTTVAFVTTLTVGCYSLTRLSKLPPPPEPAPA